MGVLGTDGSGGGEVGPSREWLTVKKLVGFRGHGVVYNHTLYSPRLASEEGEWGNVAPTPFTDVPPDEILSGASLPARAADSPARVDAPSDPCAAGGGSRLRQAGTGGGGGAECKFEI